MSGASASSPAGRWSASSPEFSPPWGQPEGRAGELLDWMERRTGLLADGEYLTFAHLAFQEYFAAGGHPERPAAAGAPPPPGPSLRPLVEGGGAPHAALADDATDFIRQVYSLRADDLLRRRLFLAGHCIGEAARVEEKLRRQVRDELLRVWREGFRKQQEEALRALSLRPDRETADFFLRALKDEDGRVRERAAAALGQLGAADERVLPALLEALKDEHFWVQERAAEALGQLGVADERVLRALLEALKDEGEWVRARAAEALGRLGAADERALQALLEALKDKSAWVRSGRRRPWAGWRRPTSGSSRPSWRP